MKELQYVKQYDPIPPISVASTTATTLNVIDTAGFDEMLVLFTFGDLSTTNLTAAKLQESVSTTQAGTFADTTNGALTDLTYGTNSNKTAAIYVNLRGHKRYFRPIVTTGASQVLGVKALLFSGPSVFPYDVTTRNVSQFIEVGSVAQ